MTRRIAVVGGGIAGLAAAHRLVERFGDADVSVLEADGRVGGVLRSVSEDGWVHEYAANAFLSGAPDGAVALCHELGVAVEEASAAAKRRWIWIDGALRALPGGPLDAIRTPLLSWRGKLRVLTEPLRGTRALGPDADESIYDFAARRLGPEVARAIVAPFVTGIFAGDARNVSVVAGFPKLAALEADGGLLRGGLAAMRKARAAREAAGGGAKRKRAPSRLTAPVGGVEALAAALADRLGRRVRTGARVTGVTPVAADVEVDIGGGAPQRFDAVVLALPATAAAPLVGAVPDLAPRLAEVEYAPVAVAYLGFRRADLAHPLDGFGFLVAQGEALPILGAVFESVLWSSRAPDGHVLIRCIIGGTREPAAVGEDDAALIARGRAALAQGFGITAAPVHTHVVRQRHGVAQYRVGHARRVADADAIARAHRLVLAGSGYHGVAVNDCIADARRVVAEVERITGEARS